MEEQAHAINMRVLVEMIDTPGIKARSAPNYAVNFITFIQQQFSQVRTILTSDSSD